MRPTDELSLSLCAGLSDYILDNVRANWANKSFYPIAGEKRAYKLYTRGREEQGDESYSFDIMIRTYIRTPHAKHLNVTCLSSDTSIYELLIQPDLIYIRDIQTYAHHTKWNRYTLSDPECFNNICHLIQTRVDEYRCGYYGGPP